MVADGAGAGRPQKAGRVCLGERARPSDEGVKHTRAVPGGVSSAVKGRRGPWACNKALEQ